MVAVHRHLRSLVSSQRTLPRRHFAAGSRVDSNAAIAHSSWFRIQEQGMKELELLARGSAFCVAGPESGVTIALGSAHVSAPHQYRRYFPADWLLFVKDKHIELRTHVQSTNGASVSPIFGSHRLIDAFRHATLDVSAAVVLPPGADLPEDVPLLTIVDEAPADAHGKEVVLAGHEIVADGADGQGEGNGVVRRMALKGRISLVDGTSRGFVYTGKEQSVMGMCGGPVVVRKDGLDVVVGMLEGLVPPLAKDVEPLSAQHEMIAGQSVYITAEELRLFVRDVEREWMKSQETNSNVEQVSK